MDKILEEIKHRLGMLLEDCNMALDGTWDKGDTGFKAMRDSLTAALNLLADVPSDTPPRGTAFLFRVSEDGDLHRSAGAEIARVFHLPKDRDDCAYAGEPRYSTERGPKSPIGVVAALIRLLEEKGVLRPVR